MKRVLAAFPAIAATLFIVATPASAQWGGSNYYDNNANGYQTQRSYRGNDRDSWNQGSNRNSGWNQRNVSGSDPSFGNRSGINAARRTGRCVTDLGYGRFEYCGW